MHSRRFHSSGGISISSRAATISAWSTDRALAVARAGRYDLLLMYRLDRFSRRIRDLATLMDELDTAGVHFRSATEPFDTSSAAGRRFVQMIGAFAEFGREVMIDRVINGMKRKAAKGQWTHGSRPYGYPVDPATHRLVPIPRSSTWCGRSSPSTAAPAWAPAPSPTSSTSRASGHGTASPGPG